MTHSARALIGSGLAVAMLVPLGFFETLSDAPIAASGVLFAAACLSAVAAAVMASGRNLSAAFLLSAVLGALAVPALLLGRYAAYTTGWNGLDMKDFGSDDIPGVRYLVISTAVWLPAGALIGALLGAAGWLIASRLASNRT